MGKKKPKFYNPLDLALLHSKIFLKKSGIINMDKKKSTIPSADEVREQLTRANERVMAIKHPVDSEPIKEVFEFKESTKFIDDEVKKLPTTPVYAKIKKFNFSRFRKKKEKVVGDYINNLETKIKVKKYIKEKPEKIKKENSKGINLFLIGVVILFGIVLFFGGMMLGNGKATNTITGLENNISNLEEEYNQSMKNSNNSIQDLEENVDILQEQYNTKVFNSDNIISGLEEDVEELQEKYDDNVDNSNKIIADLEDDIEDLEADINDLEDDVDDLTFNLQICEAE